MALTFSGGSWQVISYLIKRLVYNNQYSL
jgi:hypothetical protein